MSKVKALLVDVPLKAARQWWADDAMTLAAALAFYAMFSLAPLIIVAIAVAGVVVDEQTARTELKEQMETNIGPAGATVVDQALESARNNRRAGRIATVMGIITLLVGSTGMWVQMQASLNGIWGVRTASRSAQGTVKNLVRARLMSFVMVLAVGGLLLASLIASAVLARMDTLAGSAANFFLSLVLVTFLFMLIYKVLPDVHIAWKDVWVGALFTAVLFGLARYLIGLYLGNSAVASSYGAAGSLVVVLIWVWFVGGIVYFGAEYTQIYARNFGGKIRPADYAECIDDARTTPDRDVREAAGAPPPSPEEERRKAGESDNGPRRESPVAKRRKQEQKEKRQ